MIDDTARRLRADPNEDVPPNLEIIRKALYKSRHEMNKAGSKKIDVVCSSLNL